MKRSLPPLNGLRAFEAAARHMSFTDAAEELSVTQAAISHQVRGLEQRLGLKLFVRRNRSLLLSEAGQAYLPSVRSAFDQLNEATEKLLQKDRGGHLTVTTTASFATKWLVPRLGGFQRANPEIDVRISTNTGLVDFSREDVDIGIRYGRGQWPGLVAERHRRRGRDAGLRTVAAQGAERDQEAGRPQALHPAAYRHLPRRLAGLADGGGCEGHRHHARRHLRLPDRGLPGGDGWPRRRARPQPADRARPQGRPPRRALRLQDVDRLRLLHGLSGRRDPPPQDQGVPRLADAAGRRQAVRKAA